MLRIILNILVIVLSLGVSGRDNHSVLPVVYIDTDGQKIRLDARVNAVMTIVDSSQPDSVLIHEHNVRIKVRGKTAASYPKKSYSFEFVDSAMVETDVQLFGLRSDDDWILDAMYIDQARMRNRLCTDIWNSYNRLPYREQEPKALNGTRGTFVEVVLNGQYNGLYCLTERIDRKQLKLKKYKDTYRGVSFKAITWNNIMGYCAYNPSATVGALTWNGFETEYPGETDCAGWEYLQEFLEYIASEYTSDVLFANSVSQHVYLDNLVDYTLLVNSVYAVDNLAKNVYVSIYDVQTDRRVFFTPWDLDATFGRTYDGSTLNKFAFDHPVPFSNQLINRLWSGNVGGFKQMLVQRWEQLRHTALSVDSVVGRIRNYEQLFRATGAFAREQERWPELCAADLSAETDFMAAWYARNVEIIDSVLLHEKSTNISETPIFGSPQICIEGGMLQIDASESFGATVYTLKGDVLYSASAKTLHRVRLPYRGVYIIRLLCGNQIRVCKIVSAAP